MWTARPTELPNGHVLYVLQDSGGDRVPYSRVIQWWVDSAAFRSFFLAQLAEAPFEAFRWETPPVTADTVSRPFEHVLIDSPWLDAPPDRHAFAEHFRASEQAVTFANLGHDAVLVAPCPPPTPATYTHLAAFLREAPQSQQHELWRTVGLAMRTRVGTRPVWLSTAGGGVDWLHVRLDDRPKYYAHHPYRSSPSG